MPCNQFFNCLWRMSNIFLNRGEISAISINRILIDGFLWLCFVICCVFRQFLRSVCVRCAAGIYPRRGGWCWRHVKHRTCPPSSVLLNKMTHWSWSCPAQCELTTTDNWWAFSVMLMQEELIYWFLGAALKATLANDHFIHGENVKTVAYLCSHTTDTVVFFFPGQCKSNSHPSF